MKAKKGTQKKAVRKHLEDYGHITAIMALSEYGCFRLSHIIYKLREDGLKIDTLNTQTISRYGNLVTYATYKYEG